jgi:quinol monooxygenase YgiN
MIMETAFIAITPGHEAEFESAIKEAKKVIAQAPGFEAFHLHRGIERANTYLLAIGWRTRIRTLSEMASDYRSILRWSTPRRALDSPRELIYRKSRQKTWINPDAR